MLLGSGVLRQPLPLVAVYVRPVSVNTRRKGGSCRIGSPLQNVFAARGPPRVKADRTLMMSGGGVVGGLVLWAEIFSRLASLAMPWVALAAGLLSRIGMGGRLLLATFPPSAEPSPVDRAVRDFGLRGLLGEPAENRNTLNIVQGLVVRVFRCCSSQARGATTSEDSTPYRQHNHFRVFRFSAWIEGDQPTPPAQTTHSPTARARFCGVA
jgi:hypothetical protein